MVVEGGSGVLAEHQQSWSAYLDREVRRFVGPLVGHDWVDVRMHAFPRAFLCEAVPLSAKNPGKMTGVNIER
jgi:hypothetical protein